MALKGYSEVKDCIRAIHDAYPDCVEISTRRVEMNDSYVEVEATVVRHVDPTDWDKVLTYTGTALEQIVTYDELKPFQQDNPNKAPVNYASYLENCETSAIGRALKHAGFFDLENMGNAPSEEEIQQNQRNAQTLHEKGKAKQDKGKSDDDSGNESPITKLRSELKKKRESLKWSSQKIVELASDEFKVSSWKNLTTDHLKWLITQCDIALKAKDEEVSL